MKNKYEIEFNQNISSIIINKINEINQNNYSNIVRSLLPKIKCNEKDFNFKLTDDRIIQEIYILFEDDCISDRTFKNIKYGSNSSSTFNVFIIIYYLNSLITDINQEIITHNSPLEKIRLINLLDLLYPLKG